MKPEDLIEARKTWKVSTVRMAALLETDRVTLWKREKDPKSGTLRFWETYADVLRAEIAPQFERATAILTPAGEAS